MQLLPAYLFECVFFQGFFQVSGKLSGFFHCMYLFMAKSIQQKSPVTSHPFILPVLAGVICALAYLPALKGAFVWDDELYVAGSPLMGDLSLNGLKAIFSTFIAGNYHPFTILSLALEFPFAGKDTQLYHITNLVIHGANVALLFHLLSFHIRLPLTHTLMIVVLFGIHPTHAESVAWISERKDVLYGFFYLLALITALSTRSNSGRFMMLLWFISACLSKAVAVTFPIVWMMAEYYKNPAGIKATLQKEKAWLSATLLLALGTGILAIKAQDASLRDYEVYTLIDNFFVGFYALLFYPVKMILPVGLSAFYPYYEKSSALPPLPFLLSPLVVGIVGVGIYALRKRVPELWQGALLYLILILPVAQFLPVGNAIAADRYAYLASWGIGWMMCGIWRIPQLQKVSIQNGIIAVLTLLLFYGTWQRTKVWLSPVSLWEDVIQKEPTVPLAYYNLGNYYLHKKDPDKAIGYYEKAIQFNPKRNLHPNYTHAWNNLANAKLEQKKYEEAEAIYKQVLQMDPTYFGALINLGNVYNAVGRYDEAVAAFLKCKEIQPGHTGIALNLALAYYQAGKPEQALEIYTQQYNQNPSDLFLLHQQGMCLAAMGKIDAALAIYAQCLKLDNQFHMARMNAAVVLSQNGRSDSAIVLLREAARAGYQDAQNGLRSNGLDW